jgi:hypothetical protein
MGCINVASSIFAGLLPQQYLVVPVSCVSCCCSGLFQCELILCRPCVPLLLSQLSFPIILAEGAIALAVTPRGGVLVASCKLLQFPSSLIVKVILAIFTRALAQQAVWRCDMAVVCLPPSLASCLGAVWLGQGCQHTQECALLCVGWVWEGQRLLASAHKQLAS